MTMQELGELLLHTDGTPCHCREEYELGELISYQTHDKLRIVNSKGDGYYTIYAADTLSPRCSCPAGKHGQACKHVIELLESQLPTDLVPYTPGASALERQKTAGQILAQTRASYPDAEWVAQTLQPMWPDEVTKKPQQEALRSAAIIVMTAVELGIAPLQAFSYITVIKGKPFIMARMVNALVNSRTKGEGWIGIVSRSALACEGVAHRPGRPNARVKITIEDAKSAGWFERNPNYKSNPAAMLVARVTTTLGWLQFADVLAGMSSFEDGEFMNKEDLDTMPSGAILPSAVEGESTVLGDVSERTATEPPPFDEQRWAPSSTTQSGYPSTSTEAFGSEPGLKQGSFPTQGEGHVVAYPELGTPEADVFWDGFVQKFRNVGLKGGDISAVLGKNLSYAALVEVLVQTGMSTEELIEAAIEKVRA